jgi:hypothetical protein
MSPKDLLNPELVKAVEDRFHIPTAEEYEEAKEALRKKGDIVKPFDSFRRKKKLR